MHGTLEMIDGRPALRFERRFAHSVERVWRAITERAELGRWFVVRPEWTPVAGEMFAAMEETGEITEFVPPHPFRTRACASSCTPTATDACSFSCTSSTTGRGARSTQPDGMCTSTASTRSWRAATSPRPTRSSDSQRRTSGTPSASAWIRKSVAGRSRSSTGSNTNAACDARRGKRRARRNHDGANPLCGRFSRPTLSRLRPPGVPRISG
jgi:hypothetical protein